LKKGIQALFHLTPKNPVKIIEPKFEAYLYLYGAFIGPRYTLKEQYEQDYAIIRSTKSNQSDITSFYNQGCVRVRFKPKEDLIGKKKNNQIQFIFRVQRKYKKDTDDIQVFLWKDKVLQEPIQYKEDDESGEDYVAFITDIPNKNDIEIYLRPYTKKVYTLIFRGITAYLHD